MNPAIQLNVAKKRSLGINAKSINANHLKTVQNNTLEVRQMRYSLQRTAQSILFDESENKQHRVCGCHRNVASGGVTVYRAVDGSDSRFGNLITCGSVWSCPVCNAKITEGRREDMQKAVSAWCLDGGSCLLNTLTFPHELDMPLHELLEKFEKALVFYKNSRTYKSVFGTSVAAISQRTKWIAKGKLKSGTPDHPVFYEPLKDTREGDYPRLGTVRSLEVTNGVNGWHPHVHEVLFMDSDHLNAGTTKNKNEYAEEILTKAIATRELLTKLWVDSLLKAGLGSQDKINDMLLRAWDIRGGDYVAEYINKFGREPIKIRGWTIASEATKANSKVNSNGAIGKKVGNNYHFTPFQLLGFATDGDEKSAALFKEFSQAFEGKRMNYWTNGLKDWFSINDVDDELMASEQAQKVDEEIVFRLDIFQWKKIVATNSRNELLSVAAKYGAEGIEEFLIRLESRKNTHKGWFLSQARPDIDRFYH